MTYKHLREYRPPEARATYGTREVILYALAVGAGADLPAGEALPFVYEKGLKPLPSFYSILCWPTNAWLPQLGVDLKRLLHGSERLEILQPLAPEGSIVVRYHIGTVADRGAGKGLIVDVVAEVFSASDNSLLARATSSLFCMGDGGLDGAPRAERVEPEPLPDRGPDGILEVETRPDQAALYRLCGDGNPIHIDPDAARGLGLEKPLLHGLCTLGMSVHALARQDARVADGLVAEVGARFSAPVYPGERLRLELWREEGRIRFVTKVGADRTVLKDGVLGFRR
nr:MaoC/PaaZ C-terminal domain-containing protein [Chelatococcus sp. YT9]